MIQSIARALDIVEFLAKDPARRRSLGDVVEATGLYPNTARTIIKTLAARNYVEQQGPRKGYYPGVMCFALAGAGMFYRELVKIAEPGMERLSGEVNESVLLSVLRGGRKFVLSEKRCGDVLQVNSDIVRSSDDLNSATGILLLAFSGEGVEESAGRGPEGFSGAPDSLEKAVKLAAREGFSIHYAYDGQVAGVAYPLKRGSRVIAALGLYLPAFRFRGKHRKKILAGMKTAAEEISAAITEKIPGGER